MSAAGAASGNLLADLPQRPASPDAERLDVLLATPCLRIERIVSMGQASPSGFWYDQDRAEWVLVVSGSAGLLFEDETEPHVLGPGDWVHIAAHRRHRVLWTDAKNPTVWLAVHHD